MDFFLALFSRTPTQSFVSFDGGTNSIEPKKRNYDELKFIND